MQPIRVALVGCGSIARAAHLPAMAHLRDRVRLIAAADLNEEAVRAAAEPWDAAIYTDYRRCVEREDVDMVMIATPEFEHRGPVEAAAAAGKPVLCEKPMASSLDDADAMLAACHRAGVRLMIGHSRRFTRRYMEIRRAVDEGEIGHLRLVRENERRSRPPLGDARGYYTASHWTGDPTASVGAALTNGIHEADLLRWFTQSEPVAVFAEHKVTIEANPGVPDFITYTVRFANGALGSTEISNALPPGYPAFHQCELYGTAGAIRARDHDLIGLTRYRDGAADFPESYHILLHNPAAYVREWAGFLDALQQDRPVPMPAEEARAALELALAAEESARTGRVVRLRSAERAGESPRARRPGTGGARA
jgi:myo-inositol 2-dehydrogenase / D-chiro-inositol 1-dehydrogenase